MTLHCYRETDSLYIELRPRPGVEIVEFSDGLIVGLDAKGRVVGLDLDRASVRCDLSGIETRGLPQPTPASVEKTHAET